MDDDDRVSDDYLPSLLAALVTAPDCVVFDVFVSGYQCIGMQNKLCHYGKEYAYENKEDAFYRRPNHLMVYAAGKLFLTLCAKFLTTLLQRWLAPCLFPTGTWERMICGRRSCVSVSEGRCASTRFCTFTSSTRATPKSPILSWHMCSIHNKLQIARRIQPLFL